MQKKIILQKLLIRLMRIMNFHVKNKNYIFYNNQNKFQIKKTKINIIKAIKI